MTPIELTKVEQDILKARKYAMDSSREGVAFQVAVETIVQRYELGPGWSINANDPTQLIPPAGPAGQPA